MSELRSVIDGFRSETLSELPDARIEEDFSELQRGIDLLEAERLRRLREIDRRGSFQKDGFLSLSVWLEKRFRMMWGHASRDVYRARAFADMPETRRALDEGDLSMSAVQVLMKAREAHPDAFRESETELVEAARLHSGGELKAITAYWRQAIDRREPAGKQDSFRERRRFHASVTFLGMVRVDGDLDPETGETLLTALQAVMDAEQRTSRDPDGRTPAQRRADALGEVCRGFLDRADRPQVAGERPHVTVTVGVDALTMTGATDGSVEDRAPYADRRRVPGEPPSGSRIGRPSPSFMSEMDRVGPVDPEIARKIACDASVMRVVMAGRSEPLDVGRRTPVVPPSIRRALDLRDRECRFPSCDKPPHWCDAHHVVHWADGGPTALSNLVLLCRRHHGMVHGRGGFTLRLEDGLPVFRRADGSVLEDRAPP